MGKTVTCELAYIHPSKTRNPHDYSRTPGGSSSGSAAVVASHMAHLSIGSQTGGSIIRPASYCGVVGYKPSYGLISRNGVLNVPCLQSPRCFLYSRMMGLPFGWPCMRSSKCCFSRGSLSRYFLCWANALWTFLASDDFVPRDCFLSGVPPVSPQGVAGPAGAVGLIKAALMVHHGAIPPTVGHTTRSGRSFPRGSLDPEPGL